MKLDDDRLKLGLKPFMPNENSTGTGPGYKLDEQVGYMLRKATQRHLAIFAEKIGDLTPMQFAALSKLCEQGRVSQNQLGRMTSMDAATIKGVIDRLRKRELVETSPDQNDRRRLFVEATTGGKAAYNMYTASAKVISEQTLEPLSATERDTFLKLLAKLA